ncbi:MAG: DUF268 domain-containing protein [Mariprofundaceae bacterium]
MNKIKSYKLLAWNWILAFFMPRPLIGVLFLPRYIKSYIKYDALCSKGKLTFMESHPCLLDGTISTSFDAHYFYQGAWLARKLTDASPDFHVDVGSSVLMVSVLSASTPIIFIDFRPLHTHLSGIKSIGASITQLPLLDNSLSSLSSLHVIEHIGLGRYGDALDPEGSVRAAKELERVLKPGGKLYLSLPVGRERVCFNAHRVHAPATVLDMFSGMKILDFSYVGDDGVFVENASIQDAQHSDYACGMYVFEKV